MLCSLASVRPDICFFNSQVWFSRQIKMAPFHPMSCIKLDRTPASLKRPTKSDGHIGGPAQTLVASSTSSTALFGFRVSDLKTHEQLDFFFFPAVYQWQRGPPWSQYVVSNTLYCLVHIKKKESLLMWSALPRCFGEYECQCEPPAETFSCCRPSFIHDSRSRETTPLTEGDDLWWCRPQPVVKSSH